MAHYQGWNQERSGRNQEEGTYIVPETPMRPILSFTPVNHGYTTNFDQTSPLTRTIEPLKTLRNNDIYDLPDDAPILPTPGGVKKSKPSSKNFRAKTLPSRDQYNNVETEDRSSEQFEVSSPKRRKILAKGAQPAFKIPSKVQANVGSDGPQNSLNNLDDGLSISQLNTPPDTHKRSKKRVSSALVGRRKKSSELFQSSTITKPSLSYFTSKPPREQSQSINRLQGFTTTEEQLKLNSNGIANTTLQKLAAFRYVPRDDNSSVNQPIVASKTANINEASILDDLTWATREIRDAPIMATPVTGELMDQYHDGQALEEPIQSLSDYGHMSNDSFFEEALWIPKQFVDSNELEIISRNQSQTQLVPGYPTTSVTQQSSTHVESLPKPSEYGPTSYEVRVFDKDLVDIAIKATEVQDSNQRPPPVDTNTINQLGDMDPELLDHRSCTPRVHIQSPGTSFEQEQRESFHDSALLMPTAGPGRNHDAIQVEQSDIQDGEPVFTNLSQDHLGSDDFDDEIGDEDLLALVADPVIPVTPLRDQVVQSSPQHKVDLADTRTLRSNYPITVSQQVTHTALMNDDDDFPMDADLEEEMCRLAFVSQSQGVVESFEPPPSLRLPSDGDDTDREVYDNTLQFSPPTARSSGPPGIAQIHSTDLSSPSKPPATNEEVDWGYITSTAKAPVIQLPEILAPPLKENTVEKLSPPLKSSQTNSTKIWLDDSHEYLPLKPFARPKFPPLVQDRCPVNGLSAQTTLRVCFRIGEMLKEGGRCNAIGQDAIIELFARVNFSSREPGTSKQHFQFVDLFHDRPPFAKGILANFKTTSLAENESKVFIESSETLMARCLGRVKRDIKYGAWLLHIINIRVTDWEEIRWTKRIVCGEYEETTKHAKL